MTRRRTPSRGPGGRFLKHAQRVKEVVRPAGGVIEREIPAHLDVERMAREGYVIVPIAQRGIGPVTPSGKRCEECGEELTYAWMHSGRASYHIGRCMRCTPEPPVIVRD